MVPPTIDDALAAFGAWGTGDEAAQRALRERLWELVRDRRIPAEARAVLADAVALLDDPAAFAGAREAASRIQVRLHLEDAIDRVKKGRAAGELPSSASRDGPGGFAVGPPRQFRIPEDVDASLLEDFTAEAGEYLGTAEAALLRLEGAPEDIEAVNDVFRAFHTIKGTSSFLGLEPIASFAHEAEDLLERVRSAKLAFGGAVPELALRAVDLLKELVRSIPGARGGGVDLPADYGPLTAAMAHPDAPVAAAAGIEVAARRAVRPPGAAPEGAVKVRTDKLDRLVEMVGELVIAHSILLEDGVVRDATQHLLAQKVQHAEKIVRELQELSLGLRMVPLRGALVKLARLVRDLATRSGKQVNFETVGDETELDRTLVELLADPLMHMVRNAVDHGLESPEERLRAGKPAAGVVRIEASQVGDRVVVRLRDDGRGLQRERIIEKAILRGLIATGVGMSDSEVFDLIFSPGFSTAEVVSDVSGRGVGMDVVRRNLMSMRGRTLIESTAGEGTIFTIELPLTLAITDGMLVRVGAQRFIVPTARIRRCFRPAPAALCTVHGRGEMVQHGGEVLPLLRLHRTLAIESAQESVVDGILVVVGDGNDRVALLVDELLGQQQVVAKPLGESIGRVPGLTGGAILGDGRVGLILDVDELVRADRDGVRRAAAHAA